MKINIPNPCNENWNNMNPVEKGKHCDACSKTVFDFSKMDANDIKTFFKEKVIQKESICGRFKAVQVVVKRPWHHQLLVDLHSFIDQKIKFSLLKNLAFSILSLGFLLTGCNKPQTRELLPSVDSIAMNQKDTAEHHLLLGEIQPFKKDSFHNPQLTDSTKKNFLIKGKIRCETTTELTEPENHDENSFELMGDVDLIED